MHRHRDHAVVCLLSAFGLVALASALFGCGAPGLLEVEIVRFELAEAAREVDISFFSPPATCASLSSAAARPEPALGPLTTSLSAEDRQKGFRLRVDEVPVGEYVVFAEALSEAQAVVGRGCAEGQLIREGTTTTIRIRIP
jgi:hypothetical protein